LLISVFFISSIPKAFSSQIWTIWFRLLILSKNCFLNFHWIDSLNCFKWKRFSQDPTYLKVKFSLFKDNQGFPCKVEIGFFKHHLFLSPFNSKIPDFLRSFFFTFLREIKVKTLGLASSSQSNYQGVTYFFSSKNFPKL